MKTTKLIIAGGFLGAGKTTLLWNAAVTLIKEGLRVGLITNDQAPELVDSRLLSLNNLRVEEVSGSCFCCNFNGFTDAIQKIQAEAAADVIIAEPVGSCADLSATIMQPLKQYWNRELQIAPLSVLADPARLASILEGENAGLHPDASYIYRKQLEESDIILINKADTLDDEQLLQLKQQATLAFPAATILTISALDGTGIGNWLDYATTNMEAGKHIVEMDYDIYAHGEAVLGWLNGTVGLKGEPTDWDAFMHDFLSKLAIRFDNGRLPVGHVKIIAESGSGYITGNLTGKADTLSMRGSAGISGSVRLVINARVETAPDKLDRIVRQTLDSLCDGKYETDIIAWRYLQPGRPNPTHRFTKVIAMIAIAAMSLFSTYSTAQSRHGWRGPERNGIYPESGLLAAWPAGGPELAWETLDVGKGYSSPVIVGDRLYITGMNEAEDMEIFSAYTLDGKKVYETVFGSPWKDSYPETRTTPTVAGGKGYVVSGNGEVVCINIADGKIVWKIDGNTAFGRKTGTWGTSESPLVFDGKVIFCPGGDQTAVVALNAENGETIWKSPTLNDISNYASPLLISHNGKKQIVGLSGKNVFGIDPETGKIEWTYDNWGRSATEQGWEKISPNTPLYSDGHIFVCNGYNMFSFQLKLNDDASAVELAWKNDDFDTHVGGYVLIDGIVYGSNWINNGQGNWVALDWKTGTTKFDTAWSGGKSKGSIIAADGMLYCYDERRGAVGLVKPNPEKFDVVSEFRITKGEGPHWAHPVIDNGILYIRHGNALMAYRIKS